MRNKGGIFMYSPEVIYDIQNRLKIYDSSFPKVDELEFVNNIMIDYGVSRKEAIKMVRYVRKLNKGVKK